MARTALTKEALREMADTIEVHPVRSMVDAGAARASAAAQLREWADDMEHTEAGEERCEGCPTWLKEDEGTSDSEGVRLCDRCADELRRNP